ncbi:uncharacterized protein KY384_001007 [Bacidia gigantensis]|uniref:uncharacterized protein n=1 Tax=Bacidia gigantensis TaxID=2732470 RepID=UPI001D0555D0|nr:uncharacterized protein KY384_001007 [Bacidia gigantensis]KAG8534163.1 hypothetical protein KY384_001007 [Bacidia gigantensis]
MPATERCLSPSEGNKAIGGIPNMHYFDFKSRGRGNVIRLLWEDAQIAYDDTRYTFEEYPKYKESTITKLNPATTIPVIEIDGQILTQSYAIIRHFARQLGKYDGQTEEAKYWADAICDIVADWRTLFIQAFFNERQAETYPKHQQGDRNRFLTALETHLKSHDLSRSGPYITGKDITYADFVLYQILHDEDLIQDGGNGLQDYSRLKQQVDAVEGRENIKAFMASKRYRG